MKKSSTRKGSTRKRLTFAGVAAFAIGGMIGCNAPSASEPQAASTSKGAAAQRTSRASASAKAQGASNVRGASGQSPSSASPRKDLNNLEGAKLSITIMGDSYSSGVGGGSYSGGRCFRSPNSTGNLYAESLRKRGADVEVRDVSCANSRIEQVTISQKSAVLGSSVINGPQAEGVSSGTDLVVMTIGGNDMGFGSLLKTCLISKSQADECRNSIAEARRSLNDVEGKYRRIFSAIRQRGLRSDATIAVMAYPMLVRDDSFTLRDSSGATVHVSDEIRALSREGNKKMAEIVKADNASHPGQTIFVSDVADRFEGHQPHADRSKDDGDDLWIHPINYFAVGNFISWYHPNSAGYRQYAAALQDRLKSAGFERSLAKQKGPEHDKDSGQGRTSKQGSASSQGDASKQGNAS